MDLELVNFEQAKVLKELGFPQNTRDYDKWYSQTGVVGNFINQDTTNCFAPTLELVAKWLRRNRISVSVNWMSNVKMYNCICSDMDYTPKEHFEVINNDDNSYKFKTFEAALSAGINKAIEMLKSNK